MLVWTVVACVCLAAAVASTTTPNGRQRIAALFDENMEPLRQVAELADEAPQPLPASQDGVSAEIARLKNEARMLALEKKALAIRLALLSDEQATLTGTVGGTARRGGTAGGAATGDGTVEVDIHDMPGEAEFAKAEALGEPKVLMSEVAGAPATVRHEQAADRPYALQIGQTSTIEEARRKWTELRGSAPELTDGLFPLVAMDERNPNQLWLMAGSFADENAAGARCAMLTATGATCTVTDRDARPLPMP